MSTRISSAPGLPMAAPAAAPTAPPTPPCAPSTLQRPAGASLRKRPAAMADGGPSPTAPRAPIETLRDPKRRALAGPLSRHHAAEPAPARARHADMGRAPASPSRQGHSQAQAGTWAHSQETLRLQALAHGGTSLRAKASGEVGMGLRGQTRLTAHGRLGDALVEGRGELGAAVQAAGQVSAGPGGLSVQADGRARVGLQAESGVALRAHAAAVRLAGVRVDMTPGADAHGRASLGAEGDARVFAGVHVPTAAERAAGTGVKAGVEACGSAFAGAKAEGDAHVGIGDSRIGLTGGVWAGAGAAGKATGSLTQVNGRTTARLELKAGAALGVGGSLGLTAQVNLQPALDAAHKVATLGHAIAHRLD